LSVERRAGSSASPPGPASGRRIGGPAGRPRRGVPPPGEEGPLPARRAVRPVWWGPVARSRPASGGSWRKV